MKKFNFILIFAITLLALPLNVLAVNELIPAGAFDATGTVDEIAGMGYNNLTKGIYALGLRGGTPFSIYNFSAVSRTLGTSTIVSGSCGGTGGSVGIGVDHRGHAYIQREGITTSCERGPDLAQVQDVTITPPESSPSNVNLDFGWNYSIYMTQSGGTTGRNNISTEGGLSGTTFSQNVGGYSINTTHWFTFGTNNGDNLECWRWWNGTFCNFRNINGGNDDVIAFYNEDNKSMEYAFVYSTANDGVGITANITQKSETCCIFVQNISATSKYIVAYSINISAPTPDTTKPSLTYCNLTSEGGLGQNCLSPNIPKTNDTTPTIELNFTEVTVAGITDNITNTYVECTTTNVIKNICTESTTLPFATNVRFLVNWSDASGNQNSTNITINITDPIPPSVQWISNATLFKEGINNTFSLYLQSNYTGYNISSLQVLRNGTQVYLNSSYFNTSRVTIGTTSLGFGIYNFTAVSTDTYNNINQTEYLLITVLENAKPNKTNFTIITSSGANTSVLNLQSVTSVNFTISDSDGSSDINSVIINYVRPDGTIKSTVTTKNDYPYFWNDTSMQLDAIGTWIIQAQISHLTEIFYYNTTTLQVGALSNASQAVAQYFGYETNEVPTNELIQNLSANGFNAIGIRFSMTSFNTEWNNTKRALTTINSYNRKGFITITYDNASGYGSHYQNTTCETMRTNLTDLTISPYADTTAFILIEPLLTNQNISNFSNAIASCILSATQNNFPIYVRDYNTNLSSDYTSYWSMPQINASNSGEYITHERNFLKNSTSLTRIYMDMPTPLIPNATRYNENILTKLRGTPTGTNNLTINNSIAEISNGDIVVFNTGSGLNGTHILYDKGLTKDFWDSTSKTWIDTDHTARNLSVTINGTFASVIYIDDFDLIGLDDNVSILYKSPTTTKQNMSYATIGTSGSFTIAGANDARVELWNPDYGFNHLSFVTYSILSFDQIMNYSVYDNIIISRTATTNLPNATNKSMNIRNNPNLLSKVYGYYSYADYNNSKADGTNETNCDAVNPWEVAKTQEIDVWLDNYTLGGAFGDGYDIGFSGEPDCFEQRGKRLTDHVRIDKGKETICNTYTYYQNFVNYCDKIMRESCFSRWDGADVNNPTYSFEDLDLMLENARFMEAHGKPVICMAFGEVNNYSKMYYDYLAFSVFYGTGNNNTFRYGQPNFQTQREIRVPDLGEMLESTWTNNSNTDYSRKYSNGIVHINPQNHTGYIEQDKTINQMQVCTKAQIYSAGVTDSTPMTITNIDDSVSGTITYQEIGAAQFDTAVVCKNFTSSYSDVGHYYFRYQSQTRGNPVGLNLFNRATNGSGVHSWYDNTANNPPTESQWTAYGRSGAEDDYMTNNWDVYITVNKTIRSSVDTFLTISQQEKSNTFQHNATITAGKSFNISVRSDEVATALSNYNFIYYVDGSIKYNLTNIVNDSNCITSNPTFGSNTVNGYNHGVCSYLNNGVYSFRFLSPHLSTQEYQIMDITLPNVTITTTNNTFFKTNTLNITINATSPSANKATGYVNGTLNVTSSYTNSEFTNVTLTNLGDGNYSININVNDTEGQNINSSTINIVVDTISPVFTNISPYNSSAFTSSTLNIGFNATDRYSQKATLYTNTSSGWSLRETITFASGANNFTSLSIISSGVYGYAITLNDSAGNIQLLNYSSSITIPLPSSSSGGGNPSSGSQVNIPPVLTNPFGTPPSVNGTCKPLQQSYDGRCYDCDPAKGYLQFNPHDRSIVCITCGTGYKLENGDCKLLPPKDVKHSFTVKADEYAGNISNLFGTDNLIPGYIVLFGVTAFAVTGVYNYGTKRRK